MQWFETLYSAWIFSTTSHLFVWLCRGDHWCNYSKLYVGTVISKRLNSRSLMDGTCVEDPVSAEMESDSGFDPQEVSLQGISQLRDSAQGTIGADSEKVCKASERCLPELHLQLPSCT